MSTFKVVQLSVPDAVRTIITRNHAVFQCLRLKILNYRALAAKIQPEVEEMTGSSVKLNTIVAAIMRFSDSLSEGKTEEPSLVLKNAKLSLTDGVADMTFPLSGQSPARLWKELLDIRPQLRSAVCVFQLTASAKLIGEKGDIQTLHERLSKIYKVEARTGLAKIDLQISPEAERTPGVASFISELLYRNGINLVEALFAYGDIVLIIDETEASKAYDLIRNEITR